MTDKEKMTVSEAKGPASEEHDVVGRTQAKLKKFRRMIICMGVGTLPLVVANVVLTVMLFSTITKHNQANREARLEIIARNDDYRSLRLAGQFSRLYDFYTYDCKVMPQGRDVIDGLDALRATKLKERLHAIAHDILLDTDEVVAFGPKAVERGRYTLIKDDGSVVDRGNYLVLWSKEDGVWMMHMEIFNSAIRK